MVKMKLFRPLSVALATAILTTSSYAATKWDMPTPYGDGVHHTKNVKMFAQDIKEATGGDLNIVVHSGASLIKHPEIHKAVRTGQVPAGEMFMGLLGNANPLFKADNIPFLASDFASAKTLWKASRAAIEKSLEKEGIKLLYAVPWPPQGLYTKKEINKVEDLKGLKMRSYSPTLSRLSVLLGAAPTTVQTPEIPQAFSTGIIDAMITSPSTGVSSQSWDYITNYTDTKAWIPKNMVIVNAKAFKRLDAKTQKIVELAAQAAEARGWDMAMAETDAKTAVLAEHGIKVSEPTLTLQKGLKAIGKTMGDEWSKTAGDDGAAILKALQ